MFRWLQRTCPASASTNRDLEDVGTGDMPMDRVLVLHAMLEAMSAGPVSRTYVATRAGVDILTMKSAEDYMVSKGAVERSMVRMRDTEVVLLRMTDFGRKMLEGWRGFKLRRHDAAPKKKSLEQIASDWERMLR
jgi:predicted transcriptional regulator